MHMTAGLTLLATVIGVVGAASVIWIASRSDRSTGSVVVRAAIVVAALGLAGAVATLIGVQSTSFAVAHLLYLLVVLAVPIVGVGCAVAWVRDRSRPAMGVLALLLLVPAGVGVYATHVAPYRLREDRVSLAVPAVRAPEQPVRVGVLSDLQTRDV